MNLFFQLWVNLSKSTNWLQTTKLLQYFFQIIICQLFSHKSYRLEAYVQNTYPPFCRVFPAIVGRGAHCHNHIFVICFKKRQINASFTERYVTLWAGPSALYRTNISNSRASVYLIDWFRMVLTVSISVGLAFRTSRYASTVADTQVLTCVDML